MMHLSIERAALDAALDRVAAATSDKNPVYTLVRLRAENGVLVLSSTNGLVSVRTQVEADVIEDGDVGVDCRALSRSVTLMSEAQVVLRVVNTQLTVNAGRRTHKLGIYAEDFGMPLIPEPGSEVQTLPVEAGILKKMIHSVEFACPGDQKPQFNGIVVEADANGGKLKAVVLGNAHMIEYDHVYDGGGSWDVGMIPKVMLGPMVSALDNAGEIVSVQIDKNFTFLVTEQSLVAALIPNGAFLTFRSILSKIETIDLCRIPVEELVKLVRGVLITSDNLLLEWKDGVLRAAAETGTNMAEDFHSVFHTREFGLRMEPKYLLEPLSKLNAKKVRIGTGTRGVLAVHDDVGFRAIIGLQSDSRYDYSMPVGDVPPLPADEDSPQEQAPETQEQGRKKGAKKGAKKAPLIRKKKASKKESDKKRQLTIPGSE